MSCGEDILDLSTPLARIITGSGSTTPTVTARVWVPTRLIRAHLSIYPYFPDAQAVNPGASGTWDLVPAVPAPRGGGRHSPLTTVFDAGPRALPDGYEIESAVKLWLISAVLSVSALTPGNGHFMLGATFEAADAAMSDRRRDELFKRCRVEIDGNGLNIVNGTGE